MNREFYKRALKAWDNEGPGKPRHLRKGEAISVPELGLPNARISGTGVTVNEYPDGTCTAVIPDPRGLVQAIVRGLTLNFHRPLSGAEAIFLRRSMGWSQEHLAKMLSVSRETISKHERAARVPNRDALSIRFLVLVMLLNDLPPDFRTECEGQLRELQDIISGTLEEANPRPLRIPVPDGQGAVVELTG